MQQIHAKIKRTSKYYGQGERDALFEVFIEANKGWEYIVKGNGNSYRLKDVNLFVVVDGIAQRIA